MTKTEVKGKKTTAEAPEAKSYILEYYQAITDGSVTVGKWIRMWYQLIVDGLQKKKFFFSQKKANAAIKFIETFCRHHEGELAPGRIRLELWQNGVMVASWESSKAGLGKYALPADWYAWQKYPQKFKYVDVR